ncbi:class I SAM-dependent methyltransferase [Candidatus Zixiibacteriota bacterium]
MTQRGAAGFFDDYARDFDALYGTTNTRMNRLINHLFRKSMRLRFEKTIAGCVPTAGKTVLDVGCGPGHYGVALARRGIAQVTGIDFAPAMIELARQKAAFAGVSNHCNFLVGDYLTYKFDSKFDYVILMGLMDYMADARRAVTRALSLTNEKAFFSFPAAEGLLARQRRFRYRTKCPLYTYPREKLETLFEGIPRQKLNLEKLHRDYFVTVTLP